MMVPLVRRLVLALVATVLISPAWAMIHPDDFYDGLLKDKFWTDLDLLSGVRLFDSDLERYIGEAEPAFGLQYQTYHHSWPVGIQAGFTIANGDTIHGSAQNAEFWLGAYKNWWHGRFRRDLSIGATYHETEIGEDGIRETMNTAGVYVQTSWHYLLNDYWTIGGSARYSYGQVESEIIDETINPGGASFFFHLGALF